jgi:hypothetical protein
MAATASNTASNTQNHTGPLIPRTEYQYPAKFLTAKEKGLVLSHELGEAEQNHRSAVILTVGSITKV